MKKSGSATMGDSIISQDVSGFLIKWYSFWFGNHLEVVLQPYPSHTISYLILAPSNWYNFSIKYIYSLTCRRQMKAK